MGPTAHTGVTLQGAPKEARGKIRQAHLKARVNDQKYYKKVTFESNLMDKQRFSFLSLFLETMYLPLTHLGQECGSSRTLC